MKLELRCLFESDDVVIVEKPAGFLSVPSTLGKKDPRPVVGLMVQQRWGSALPVHRLDFEVAGVLLFARNAKAQSALHKIWEEREVEKTYRALSGQQNFQHWPENVAGRVSDFSLQPIGEWKSLIVQGKRRSFIASHGQSSLTSYQVDVSTEPFEWSLNPHTGRRHQLRLEMSRHGFPVLGDGLYGGKTQSFKDEIALVASGLHFHKKANLQLPDSIELGWNWEAWKTKFKL